LKRVSTTYKANFLVKESILLSKDINVIL